MAQAARLDPTAFAAIYERHRATVYRYLRSRTTSDDAAGDLCATTFERALSAIDRFRPAGGGMLAWLLRIARNAHLDSLRRSERGTSSADFVPESVGQSHAGPEDAAEIRSLIADLPATQRDAIQILRGRPDRR